MALTEKQRRFVDEYLIDLNATQAAIRAGYAKPYASRQGHQLLEKPHVKQAIAEAIKARSERTKIDADWLLRRLAEEVEADIAALYNEDGSLKPVDQWPLIWRKGLVAGIDVEEIREDGRTVGTLRKIKLSDRIRRLELIGKHVDVQAFRDQVGLGAPNGGPLQVEDMTKRDADDFARRVAGLAAGVAAGGGTSEAEAGD